MIKQIPDKYKFLTTISPPKMVTEALKLYGIQEFPGTPDNMVIIDWAEECGLADSYNHDEIPWCGLFMAVVAKRGGKTMVKSPLWALNWAKFGVKVSDGAKLGDVLVFRRGSSGGHVGLYIGEDATHYHVLGGNQGDEVSIVRLDKGRTYAIRRPDYKVMPQSVKKYQMGADGPISTNEA